jgi:hypothetical protein
VGDSGKLYITTFDASNDAANVNSVELDETDSTFKLVFKTDNLKLIPGTYDVEICHKGIAHFVNADLKIEYWIALETTASSFEG